MFLPTNKNEMENLGWKQLDVILVTGDAYIDSPYIGIAIIGKYLLHYGYKVGIIAQPDINSDKDIHKLGEPRLFWGVSSGSIDSIVANYTALNKPRRKDDYTPGGINNKRPDRATIAYTNLIRQNYKNTAPIILGGIEASLRRIAHYDYKTDTIRRSILIDSKADAIVYGMGERTIKAIADRISEDKHWQDINGISYIAKKLEYKIENSYIKLPTYEEVKSDKKSFTSMFKTFYDNNEPSTAKGLVQEHAARYVIQNPPAQYLDKKELDLVYDLDYELDAHPEELKKGNINALNTIRFSVTTHRGCYGECNFCAIAVHQGKVIRSRSEQSILEEVNKMTKHKKFKGIISDVGGATANMYGSECEIHKGEGHCNKRRCLFPKTCNNIMPNHDKQITLLQKIRKIDDVRKVFVASGIRTDLIKKDPMGNDYIEEICKHHVSGQLKLAPEHTEKNVLMAMGKPDTSSILEFKQYFDKINKQINKKQFLTYYLIAAYPNSSIEDMKNMNKTVSKELKISPEQVQIFTPTPSTWATVMYYTGINPFTGKEIFVERGLKGKMNQKDII